MDCIECMLNHAWTHHTRKTLNRIYLANTLTCIFMLVENRTGTTIVTPLYVELLACQQNNKKVMVHLCRRFNGCLKMLTRNAFELHPTIFWYWKMVNKGLQWSLFSSFVLQSCIFTWGFGTEGSASWYQIK